MFDLKTRILILDDMTTMRKLAIKACKEIGFTDITEASDGALGWEALLAASPPIGLILSDWDMPNCTGIDLLKRVRGDSRYKHLPFVLLMLAAEAQKTQINEAAHAGVTEYIVKPFTTDSVKAKLQAAHQKLTGG
jgi:two-component system chemotaxis response regulator CheY